MKSLRERAGAETNITAIKQDEISTGTDKLRQVLQPLNYVGNPQGLTETGIALIIIQDTIYKWLYAFAWNDWNRTHTT